MSFTKVQSKGLRRATHQYCLHQTRKLANINECFQRVNHRGIKYYRAYILLPLWSEHNISWYLLVLPYTLKESVCSWP